MGLGYTRLVCTHTYVDNSLICCAVVGIDLIWAHFIPSMSIHFVTLLPSIGPGLSMFHICWISVNGPLWVYAVLHIFGYILPLILSGIVAVSILFLVFRLLRTKLPASSEIRREVLKQNFLFVSFITVEFIIYMVLWIAQMITVSDISCPRFGNVASLALAGLFAFTHGSKGVVDFVLWCLSNSIKWKDIRGYFCCLCGRNKRYTLRSGVRSIPLINKENIEVDKTLRRDVMYAINLGILKVIDKQIAKKEEDRNRFLQSEDSLGDVVDDFIEAKERVSGEKVILAGGGSKDVKMSFKPPDLGLAIKFVNVEPEVFAHLRVSYGTNLEGYRESFFINDIRDIESSGMLERFTEGKSGSFFYFTRDSRYIIKTVTDQEVETMKKLAAPYYSHMRDNPDTLLPRFFGLYRVRMASEQKYISVIVMDNIFFSESKMKMTVKYDLKGSTHGRRTLKRKKTARDHYKGTLKDLDLDRKIVLGPDNTERLLRQLEEDTKFLSNYAIMDYSLLLGIHVHSGKEQSHTGFIARALPGETGFTVVDSPPSASNTESEIGFGSTSSSMTFHIPWFRQDGGGLRSTASNHPASGHNMATGVSDSVEMLEMSSLNGGSVPETYFIGIIDILQEYNWTKRAEHFLKTKFFCANPHAISAVNQKEYAERFVNFMKNSVFVHE